MVTPKPHPIAGCDDLARDMSVKTVIRLSKL